MKKIVMLVWPLLMLACAGGKQLAFEQYSVAMNLPVEADSSVFIGTGEKFNGVLWLQPVLKAEQVSTSSIKIIQNYGAYYVCAERFKNIWVVQPKADGLTAKTSPIDVTPKDKTDAYSSIGFSRYGTNDKAMVRFRFGSQEVFIDKKGGLHETYK
jgi:hypothetical protein